MREPLKIWFCQFARRSSLVFSLSAIAPKIMVRSKAKSDWAISKGDAPSSESMLYCSVCRMNGTLFGQFIETTPENKIFTPTLSSLNTARVFFFIIYDPSLCLQHRRAKVL